MRHALRTLYCILVLSVPFKGLANITDPYFFQQLDNRNGLSNSAINHLFCDADNILWAATWDGLNMYDGSAFHVFNYSKDNPLKSIGNNVVLQITESIKGDIWMSTVEGVSRYDKHTGKFSNYFYARPQSSKISEQEYALLSDSTGQIFCLNKRDGLTWYNTVVDSFVKCTLPTTDKIVKAAFDGANRLWVLTGNNQLQVFSHQQQQFRHIQNMKEEANNFFYSHQQLFYTTPGKQLITVDPQTLRTKIVAQLPHPLKAITFYQEHYFLAWTTQGAAVYDQQFQPATFLQQETQPLQDMRITSWACGTENVLWCGTDGNGIIKIYPRPQYFGAITRYTDGLPYNKPVRAFCAENGNLWVGTKGSGIICVRDFWKNTRKATGKQLFTAPEQLENNAVFALYKGMDNLIYIGTDGRGLGVFDATAQKFIKWENIGGSIECPTFGSVYAILQDKDSSLWLGTSGYGLIHLLLQRDTKGQLSLASFEQFTFNGTNTGPANDIIYALAPGDDNELWIGCRYGGLNLFNKDTRRFRAFKAFSYEGGLSHNDVLAIYKDRQQRIWVGTSYGLNWMPAAEAHKAQPLFQKFTTSNGLPNNTIHTVTADSNGFIWVSTNKGLARINPGTGDISHFQEADGLQSNEFSDGAVWTDPAGYLFFGGTYGFNFFQPANIRERNWHPNLLVSGLQLAGKGVEEEALQILKPGSTHHQVYTLNRRDDFFELKLKAVSFLQAEKCEYTYYLEGYDKTWHYSGVIGKIAYSNIPPGKYILKVKWSNGEGAWTQETSVFQITIRQYFWLTWPAFLLYFIIIAGAGYAFHWYRKNKLEMKHQLAMEHLLRKKEEEVHQEQLSFFTNIAHELQTPLTLIVGAVERFGTNGHASPPLQQQQYFLSLVRQQASRLTYLVQQLLEFRKAEAGFLQNHYNHLNISALLDNLSALFVPMGEQRKLQYTRDIAPDIIAWTDKDKLEKIMFNLLSNAFKHSPPNQEIRLLVQYETVQLKVTVANSGCHIPAGHLDKLFDKFFASGTNEQEKFSAGIGLAFTRQLVSLLQGQITVESRQNWVTFTVLLPLSHTHTANAWILREDNTTDTAPSYLFHSMTADHEKYEPAATRENNKQALLREWEEDSKASILVVEDDHAIRYLLKDILLEHYIIYEAENAAEALGLLQQTLPDLIISDIMMPGTDGLTFCEKVKNAPATCHIPVILLSARGAMEQQTAGYESGADAYIPKPFHTAHLLVRVRKLLEYRQRLHQLFAKDNEPAAINSEEILDTDKQFLQELVKVIELNLDNENLSATMLEKELAMSKMQLYRKLKTISNMTPGEFIRRIRLQHAAQLLAKSKLNVAEIFYRTGFNNQSYFFREFKKMYQCSPTEYRAQQSPINH